jgi:hypothetical protein
MVCLGYFGSLIGDAAHRDDPVIAALPASASNPRFRQIASTPPLSSTPLFGVASSVGSHKV